MRLFLFLIATLIASAAKSQYAPQAGVPGSTAISATSGLFACWASGCTVQRGYMDIANPGMGFASYGYDALATGAPDYSIVSLGDSGVAVVTFPGYIFNGVGADFAVFENGFINSSNDSQAFLELAFVEVSSDGINYTRFPAHSLTQTNTQIPGAGVYMYANLIDGLAGKYGKGFGTPFDLDDLPDNATLNKNHISHVRLVDVVGSVREHASLDVAGNPINDPYPTNFNTGGFDLDAVGVLHIAAAGAGNVYSGTSYSIYPNPAVNSLHVSCDGEDLTATITTLMGNAVTEPTVLHGSDAIAIAQLPSGIYYLVLQNASGYKWVEKFVKG